MLKNLKLILIAIFFSGICLTSFAAFKEEQGIDVYLKNEANKIGLAQFTASDYKPGIVKHIVLFRFNNTVTTTQKNLIRKKFLALKNKCLRQGHPYILGIEGGNQMSGEGLAHGFEQAYIITFKSEGDRNYYVGQPIFTNAHFYDSAHQEFKDFVGPFLDKPINSKGALVFDFAVS